MRRIGRLFAVVLVIAVIAALAGVLATRNGKSGQGGLGSVKILNADVNVTHATPLSIADKSAVAEGDRIQTDHSGLARLEYFDKSITRIGPDTDFVVDRLRTVNGQRQVVATLDVGKTWHRVSKASGTESRYEVKTSNAVAAVRGTALLVSCSERRRCIIGVAAGSVEVTDEDGTKRIVPAGKQVKVVNTKIEELEELEVDDFVRENLELDQEEAIVQSSPESTVVSTTSSTTPETTTTSTTSPPTTLPPEERPVVTSPPEPPYPPRL